MARHELALCTPATGKLYQRRFGQRPVREMPYRQALEWGGLRLTTYPAGHCLGSAMLLAEDGDQTLLYSGDFKLGESATAEPADLPRADILVIESTYGHPLYRHTPRGVAIDQLCTRVREALDSGATPVVQAYALGKSQEVSRILSDAGFPVLQHANVYAITEVYRECGVDVGNVRPYPGHPLPGHVIVTPPRMHRGWRIAKLGRTVTFAVTGWAMHENTRYRLGVDHAIPLSDHADFDQLFAAVERVAPKVVYCTHGPVSFVDHLRAAGWNALPLAPPPTPHVKSGGSSRGESQMRLFD